jgi:signal transduction histidine kinase
MSERAPSPMLKRVQRFFNSLTTRLMLFLLAMSLPLLFLVEFAILSFEYWELSSRLKAGALKQQANIYAAQLQTLEPQAAQLRTIRLELESPKNPWLGNAYALAEFSTAPIAVYVHPTVLSGSKPGLWRAQAKAPTANQVEQYLTLELRLMPPWRRASTAFSLEWPVMLCCLVLLGLCAEFFMRRVVVHRLERIAERAESWARSNYSEALHDESRDQIGVLTRRLNGVALALRDQTEQRVRLASQLERERLAQDLHDSVKQHGFALELQLGALEQALKPDASSQDPYHPSSRALSEAKSLSVTLRRELDVILGQLRAPVEASLLSALQRRADDFQRRNGLSCSVEGTLESGLQEHELQELLKIVDEALANVVRHAQARSVRLRLAQVHVDHARLLISDDGRGFDTGIEHSSMGVKNMQERARRLPDGRLQLRSGAQLSGGIGTEIEVLWRLR